MHWFLKRKMLSLIILYIFNNNKKCIVQYLKNLSIQNSNHIVENLNLFKKNINYSSNYHFIKSYLKKYFDIP